MNKKKSINSTAPSFGVIYPLIVKKKYGFQVLYFLEVFDLTSGMYGMDVCYDMEL